MKRSKLFDFLRETRTRIFLIYVALMLGAVCLAVPIFQSLLFSAIDDRVRDNLAEEVEKFDEAYTEWAQSENPTFDSLVLTIDNFMSTTRPEDDNFHITILDNRIYRSTPGALPEIIDMSSDLFADWSQVDTESQDEQPTGDSKIGTVLYVIQPLEVENVRRGQFVIVHLSAGEREEALAGVYVFVRVVGLLVALALGIAWWLTGRLLRPVKDLSKTALAISETDLSGRIDVQGTGELAQLATTFNAMMDRLQGAFKSQRDFVNDAGHELRTPITIMQGHLELMGDDPDEQMETVDLVMDELERMGRLVNDLILIVKSENPQFLRLETLDVSSFCHDLFAKAQTLADRKWQLTVETQVRIIADPHRLTGALLNLLNNAAQHTQPKDLIELGCRRDGTQVEFWVKDTGEGIPESEQSRMFNRFARVQYTRRKSEGSGLGLAIVQAIAEAHCGQVGVSSQPGMGAVFTLRLPIELSQPIPAA